MSEEDMLDVLDAMNAYHELKSLLGAGDISFDDGILGRIGKVEDVVWRHMPGVAEDERVKLINSELPASEKIQFMV